MVAPLTVLIIRHAEKPVAAGPPGLTAEGVADDRSLTPRGWQRAGAWAALFGAGLGGADYPEPAAIYAAHPERAAVGRPSRRMLQTVQPLADRLGLAPVTRFAKGEEGALAREVADLSGAVLVCWAHELIPGALLPALLGHRSTPGAPTRWDPSRFDPVLRLDRPAPGAPWTLRQLLPRLMVGDGEVPLA